MSYKLKCCPICGGNVKLECAMTGGRGDITTRAYRIKCGACMLSTPSVEISYYFNPEKLEVISDFTKLEQLIERWNGDRFDGYGSDS